MRAEVRQQSEVRDPPGYTLCRTPHNNTETGSAARELRQDYSFLSVGTETRFISKCLHN